MVTRSQSLHYLILATAASFQCTSLPNIYSHGCLGRCRRIGALSRTWYVFRLRCISTEYNLSKDLKFHGQQFLSQPGSAQTQGLTNVLHELNPGSRSATETTTAAAGRTACLLAACYKSPSLKCDLHKLAPSMAIGILDRFRGIFA
jgi:hypothetical protein